MPLTCCSPCCFCRTPLTRWGLYQFGAFAYATADRAVCGDLCRIRLSLAAAARGGRGAGPETIARLFADVLLTKVTLCLLISTAGLLAAESVLAISRPLVLMRDADSGITFPACRRSGSSGLGRPLLPPSCAPLRFRQLRGISPIAGSGRFRGALQSAVQLAAGLVSLPFIGSIGLSGLRSVRLAGIATQLRGGWVPVRAR